MQHASTIHSVDAGEFSVRSVLVHGRNAAMIWDTLTHPKDMEDFAAACNHQRCFVVYSHADWDHVQGTATLDGSLVIAHRECAERFRSDAPKFLASLRTREPGKWDDVTLIPPSITFDRHLDIDLGDMLVSLHHLPGHTTDSIVAFVPNMKLLLVGDAVEIPCPSVPPGCNLGMWIRSLERWREHTGVRMVIPSHGPTGGKEILDQTIAYLKGLQCGAPLSIPDDAPPFYVSAHAENLRNCGLLHP